MKIALVRVVSNVRTNPEFHSRAFVKALEEGKTLNQFAKEAIEAKILSI